MEMNRSALLGIAGLVLAAAGFVVYTLLPDKVGLVSLCEGLALLCFLLWLGMEFQRLRSFSARRSTQMGAHSILLIALFGGILVIVNFLAARHSVRWDFSENQNYTLSPETHRILRNLAKEVSITVFTREKDPGFQSYRERLDSYRQASNRLTVQFVDPERQPKIAQNYGISRTDTAVFESGGQSVRIMSPSEVEITGALLRVSKDTKKRIVFLEGHGERNLEDKDRGGLSLTKEALGKQGYEVGTLSLLQETAVPDNTQVLIIAGPRRVVTKDEKDRLLMYVAKGGHLMVLVDPDTQADLDDLLTHWGLELGRGVLVDLQDRLAQGDLTHLLVRTFTEHEITQDLTSAVLFPLSRHIRFLEDMGKDWDYVPLARTSPRSWAETDLKGRVVSYNEKEDVQGPLALAAALTPKKAPEEGKPRPAIVLVGNSAFASNGFINFPGNSDFFLHSVGWLAAERDLISISPKEQAMRPFVPNPLQERILLYVQVILLPATMLLTGVLVWRKRRRL
jgi:ABC-type uncharacterized transport system involved in gliding motility auxiliary subunit